MVLKRKKVSVSTILCVVLGCLLALSLALGLTGAWFTDTAKSGDTAVKFGNVSLADESITISSTSDLTKVLPSMKINYTGTGEDGAINYTGNVNAFYRLVVTVSDAKLKDGTALSASTDPTLEEFEAVLASSTVYGSVSVGGSIASGYLEISKDLGNEFQDISCKIVVELTVIQQEGRLAEAELDAVPGASDAEGWAKVFAGV